MPLAAPRAEHFWQQSLSDERRAEDQRGARWSSHLRTGAEGGAGAAVVVVAVAAGCGDGGGCGGSGPDSRCSGAVTVAAGAAAGAGAGWQTVRGVRVDRGASSRNGLARRFTEKREGALM